MRSFIHLSCILAFLSFCNQAVAQDTATSPDDNPYMNETKCYGLPYGALGFVSHVLTYYAMLMLCLNKRPMLPPGGDLETTGWNIFLAISKIILTVVPSVLTMVRCSHAWQFEAMAGMKLALSLTSGLLALTPGSLGIWWLLLYFPGLVAGTAGTISLAAADFTKAIQIITGVFGGLSIVVGILFLICGCVGFSGHAGKSGATGFGGLLACIVICGALYTDWVLAEVGENLIGFPSGDSKAVKALWVMYWVGKRLNLFMM